MAQENISSYSAWSEKVGAWALLYFAQVSRHLMPSVEMVSKRTLDLTGLKICKVGNFGFFDPHPQFSLDLVRQPVAKFLRAYSP